MSGSYYKPQGISLKAMPSGNSYQQAGAILNQLARTNNLDNNTPYNGSRNEFGFDSDNFCENGDGTCEWQDNNGIVETGYILRDVNETHYRPYTLTEAGKAAYQAIHRHDADIAWFPVLIVGGGLATAIVVNMPAAMLLRWLGEEAFEYLTGIPVISIKDLKDVMFSLRKFVATDGSAILMLGTKVVKGSKQVIGKTINQLNELVKKGKVPKSIKRFDKGKDINQPVDHVHFKDGSALRKDGIWRHGGRQLTNDEIKFLEENGWTIPQ